MEGFCPSPRRVSRWRESLRGRFLPSDKGNEERIGQHTLLSPDSRGRQVCRLRELPVASGERARCPLRSDSPGHQHHVQREPADGRWHLGVPGNVRLRRRMLVGELRATEQSEQAPGTGHGRCRSLRRRHGQHRARRRGERTAQICRGCPLLCAMGRHALLHLWRLSGTARL